MKVEQKDFRDVLALMGKLLGCQVASEADLVRLTSKGVATGTYTRVARALQLEPGVIARAATLRRRLKRRARLTQVESDRLLRIMRVYCRAVQFFGDTTLAREWLKRPAQFITGEQPMAPQALAKFDSGARLLEALIDRTAHGVI